MDEHTQLIERMASISPSVHSHIADKVWLTHIDADEVDLQSLTLECFSVIISEAFEIGVEFYCTLAELCDSLYHLDKVLLLLEVIFPTPLYRSITDDVGFRTWLTATVCDGAGEPDQTTVMNILHYLAFEHPGATQPQDVITDKPEDVDTLDEPRPSIFEGSYQLLWDKVKSTPVFDNYLLSILNVNATSYTAPIDPSEQNEYMDYVHKKITRLFNAVDGLNRKAPDTQAMAKLQFDRIDAYKVVLTAEDVLANYTWAYITATQNTSPTPVEQALLVKFKTEQQSMVPLFESYFRLLGEKLTRDDCVSLALGCYDLSLTKEAFITNVTATFGKADDMIADVDAHVFIQTVCLTLAGMFEQ